MTFTKEALISEVSEDTGMTKKTVETLVEAVFNNITLALSQGKKVKINGFGLFEPKHRAPRTGRNPHTNKPVPIPERTVPSFTAGKFLKEAVRKLDKS